MQTEISESEVPTDPVCPPRLGGPDWAAHWAPPSGLCLDFAWVTLPGLCLE